VHTTFGNVEGSASVDGVVLGVDTHLDLHVAVAVDWLGRRLGELTVPTTARGYERLLRWAEGFGPVGCAGIEGTSSYGAGLARHLKAAGVSVVEVERPKRRHLRRKGKSDPIDAEAAARAVLAGEALGEPKSGDGKVEMIRTLRSARHSAVKARSQAANQLKALLVTAPEELLGTVCASFRPRSSSLAVLVSASAMTPTTLRQRRSSRSVRWPAVMRLSRRRSSSLTCNWTGWWRRSPRSLSPCQPSALITLLRSSW
jgi:predicted nuclease with RNAse H fold